MTSVQDRKINKLGNDNNVRAITINCFYAFIILKLPFITLQILAINLAIFIVWLISELLLGKD